MNPEMKTCQNCHSRFVIDSEDLDFYKKIDVPLPSFCSQCRLQRRMAVRNERTLYKRECALCKEPIIAMFSADKPITVYCKECWWGDKWDPIEYGHEYDFTRPFFVQFHELIESVPRPNVIGSNLVNSDYSNYVAGVKNCYLCFGSIATEDCLYGAPYESKNCVDTYLARECEYCYECIDCEKLSGSLYCQDCVNSLGLLYCFDCKNCQDCIGCSGLRNKKYHIFNEEFSREDYENKRNEILQGGFLSLEGVRAEFERKKIAKPHRFATILQSMNVAGDHIVQAKNAKECFDVKRVEDSRYCIRMIDAKDCRDTNYCEFMELSCDYIGFWKSSNIAYSNTCGECHSVMYCDFCSGSSDLFGCVGLRNKQYCILNKQYPKEEYRVLLAKIRKQMVEMPYRDSAGRTYSLGEFPAVELSPFSYNETIAQEFFPLGREEIIKAGYSWKEPEEKHYEITRQPKNIPNSTTDVTDDIINDIIGCSHNGACKQQCVTAFRIIPEEIQFYRKMNIPIPRLCPNCRHAERLAKRNPFKVWHRKCGCSGNRSLSGLYKNTAVHAHGAAECPNEFDTSYAPDRPEIVYCEGCYQAEVV